MNQQVKNWIARDPDPKTRQELEELLDYTIDTGGFGA